MTNGQAGFQKLDLPKSHFDRIHLYAWYAKGSPVADALLELLGEDSSSVRIGRYRRSKTLHQVMETIVVDPDDNDLFMYASVEYEVIPSSSSPLRVPRERVLATSILGIIEEADATFAHRRVTLEFQDEDNFSSLFFPLPIVYPEDARDADEWPMDELRGVRGVKFRQTDEGREEAYTFILDRPTNEGIYLTLTLGEEHRIPSDALRSTVSTVKSIVSAMGIAPR